MTATRENLTAVAREIRRTLPDLTAEEVADAIREVLRHYAPHSKRDDLDAIIRASEVPFAEPA